MFFGTGLIWINRLKRSEKGKTCIEENLPLNQLKILQNRADGGTVRLRNAQLQRLHYAVEMPRASELDVAGGLFFWGGYIWICMNDFSIYYNLYMIYSYMTMSYLFVEELVFFCGGNLQKCLISHVSACVVLIDMEVRLIKWTKLKCRVDLDFCLKDMHCGTAWNLHKFAWIVARWCFFYPQFWCVFVSPFKGPFQ